MPATEPRWRRSSRSSDSNICVEVAKVGHLALLRDSKHPGPVLTVPADALTALLTTSRS
ncbi:DUF397 domain-containing protein [Actinophytocola xanthii]|uniref:DUF397 domain-containing protein n=1 Tax=Actinophytocola xanthii TaxID=1912961 RepID=A0A1Q8CMR2_9PSEU|nr:DUF397 domain-containing protein [Actinophytocola xanthii]OLF15646.1 hypothetical protein BU204_20610 [Actinophytocola xanthii]